MGMLPFATRTIAELIIWVGLALYILARASGVDTLALTQLNNEKAQTFLEILVNSPYCFAYEDRIVRNNEDSGNQITSVEELKLSKPGVIDIKKIYDIRHQNCLRKAEVWDNAVYLQESSDTGKIRTCDWSMWGFLDWNDDCGAGYECRSGVCVSKGQEIKASEGTFITYNVTLKDEDTGNTYSFISYEQGTKLVYQPSLNRKNLVGNWAGGYYNMYLTCESNFGSRKVTAEAPVLIQYDDHQNLGVISITMCIGTYRAE